MMITNNCRVGMAFVASTLFVVIALGANRTAAAQTVDSSPQPSRITSLRTLDGENVLLPPESGHLVVCFLGIECPLGKLYAPRLEELSKAYRDRGFQFVAVNSNRQDSTQEWHAFTQSNGLSFPVYKDLNNRLADQLSVKRNPEIVVLNTAAEVVYRGRVDDQYTPGIARANFSRQDLREALDELAAGKTVSVPVTQPEGCLLGRIKVPAQTATVTYARDVAPIFQKNCVECHRAGEIGPFAMADYDEVVGWADMILETIDQDRMPPWHADPDIGEFANSRGLTDREKRIVRTWVEEGAQLGDPSDLPEPVKFTQGWRLPREPDLVLSMRTEPYQVPADGTVEYQYFVVDPKFTEDRWVSAAEIIPGNREILHHSIVFIRPADGQRGVGLNWLEAYVPGKVPIEYVASRARKIPAGSKLVFQQHYTPNGRAAEDLTKIGLVFAAPEDVREELVTLAALNQDFEIQPGEAHVAVQAKVPWLPAGGRLLSISPHMHFRGKSFAARADDGEQSQAILSVPSYDFNWQHIYELSRPLPLDSLNKIEVEIVFDNSTANPFNPDPNQYVVWGDQTWEEMAVGFFNIAVPRQQPVDATPAKVATPAADKPAGSAEPTDRDAGATAEPVYSDDTIERARQYAKRLFEKNDANGDGQLTRGEMPLLARRNFSLYDVDRDQIVTPAEVESKAKEVYHARPKVQKKSSPSQP